MTILGVHQSLPILGEVPVMEGAMVGGTASSITLGQLAQTINDVLAQHLKVHAVWWSDASDANNPDNFAFSARLHTSPALGVDDGGALPQTNLVVRAVIAPSRFDATSKPDPHADIIIRWADGTNATFATLSHHHNYRSPDVGPATYTWVETRIQIDSSRPIADQTFDIYMVTADLCQFESITVYEQTLLALDSTLELAADNSQMLVGSRIYDSGLQSIYRALRKIHERQGAVLFSNAGFDCARSYALTGTVGTITATTILQGNSTSALSTYVTGSASPTGNRLYVASIENFKATTPDTPTITGWGLTWVQAQTGLDVGGVRRLTVFRAMGAAPTSGTLSIAFGANQVDVDWIVDEYQNVDTSGTNGSGAVIQVTAPNSTGVTTTNTVTLTLSSSSNAAVGCFAISGNPVPTVGTGYTQLGSQSTSTPNTTRDFTEWKLNGSNPSISWTGSLQSIGIGLEIKAAPAAAANVVDPTISGYTANAPGFWCDPQYHGSLNDSSVGVVLWWKRKPAAGAGSTPTASPLRISFVYSGGTIGYIDVPDDMVTEGTSTFSAVGTYAKQVRWMGASALTGGVKVDVLAQYNDGNSNAGPDRMYSFGAYEKEPDDPRSIPNLAVWLAADKLVAAGLTDGSAVGTWADASGNSNSATQGTAGNKPIFKTGIISNMPVVRFDGVDDFMAIADSATYKGGTIEAYMVVRETQNLGGGVSRKLIVGYPDNATFATPFYRWAMTVAKPVSTHQHQAWLNGSAALLGGNVLEGAMGAQMGVARLVCLSSNYDTISKIVRNGKLVEASGGGPATITYPNAVGLRLGGCDGTHDNYGFDLAELLIFTRQLTVSEKLQLHIYLAEKYGLGLGNF